MAVLKIVPYKHCAVDEDDECLRDVQWFKVYVPDSDIVLYADKLVSRAYVEDEVWSLVGKDPKLRLFGPAWVTVGLLSDSTVQLLTKPVSLLTGLEVRVTEPATRADVVAEAKLEDHVDADVSVSVVSDELSRVVESDGLCYLQAVEADKRAVAESLLGSFPTVQDLLVSGYVSPTTACYDHGSYVHVDSGGLTPLSSVQDVHTVVGGPTTNVVRDEYRALMNAMNGTVQDTCLVYLRGEYYGVLDTTMRQGSRVVRVPVRPSRIVADGIEHGRANVVVDPGGGVSAVLMPYGVRVLHDGVTYGNDGIRVMVLIRGLTNSFDLLPPRGNFSIGDADVSVTILSSVDTRLHERFEQVLPARSTHARFVRETEASVVLAAPVGHFGGVGSGLAIVQVDDPLEYHRAMNTVRYECPRVTSGYRVVMGGQLEWSVLCALRFDADSEGAHMVVNDVVQLTVGAQPVMLFGTIRARLFSPVAAQFAWSCREVKCIDEYAMDRGGPSGSDYSDALW